MSNDLSRRRDSFWPWITGLIFAIAFCSNYAMMYSFRSIWQSHYPDLAKHWSNDGPFSVLGLYGTELTSEELLYASRAKESSERLLAFDPFIQENRSKRLFVMENLTYRFMGGAFSIARDPSFAWILIRFVCCALWVVLLFHISKKLGASPQLALFSAVFIAGFSYILTFLFIGSLDWSGGLISALRHNAWVMLSYGRTEGIMRLPRPGVINLASYVSALLMIVSLEKNRRSWALLTGVVVGLLAYVRVDVWTTHLGGLYLLTLVSLREKKTFQNMALATAIATLLSLPYVYFTHPPEREWMIQIGMTFERVFRPYSIPYLLAGLIGLRYRRGSAETVISCLLGAIFLILNLEMVTGYHAHAHTWRFLGNTYIFLLAISFLPAAIKRMQWPALGGCAALIFVVWLQSTVYAAVHFPFSGIPRDYAAAYQWLRDSTPRDSVVLALNPEINYSIPTFTDNKTFVSCAIPNISDFPLVRNARRLLTGLALISADEKRFLNDMFKPYEVDRRDLVAQGLMRGEVEKAELYAMVFFLTPKPRGQELLAEARAMVSDALPDYVWIGHLEKLYQAKLGPQWKEVYSNSSVTLYGRVNSGDELPASAAEKPAVRPLSRRPSPSR